ncbi:MAG: sulfotransferase [Steroidobacteraceae bacterium]|nr:sulfotransferase [Steroidobacteraceae bacterium]
MPAKEDQRAMEQQAMLLDRAGRVNEAIAAYERLLARWPDLPDCWYNLAILQRKARRFDAALASYQQALDRGVSRPEEVHVNRGVIYSEYLRRDDAAVEELQAALGLNPTFVPALLNLANIQEGFGRREEALALYERILLADPHCYDGLTRYAHLKASAGPDDALVDRLRRALQHPGVAAADQASLGFALGEVLDKAAAYDQAFDAYAAANLRSRASAGPRGARYDRKQQEDLVDQLIATFSGERPEGVSRDSAAKPIFVCGMFRSGSTLTEQVLAGHSRVAAGGEIDFLPRAVRRELAPFPSSMAQVSGEQLARLADRYLEMLAKLFPGARYVTDKRPDNFLYIGLIKTLFPDARIVHTRRNALDNCLSIFFLHIDHGMAYALDLMDIGHYYRQYRRLMAHWQRIYGDDILDFDYDEFVSEPREAVGKLLAFCTLEWDENCLAFQRQANSVKTASVWQVRQPLYRHSSGRSRHYARHLADLDAYLKGSEPTSSPG